MHVRQLTVFIKIPDFSLSCLQVTLDSSHSQPVRQLAALTLKNYVDTHWSSKTDKFVGPEVSEHVNFIHFKHSFDV